jgi:single-strand DNA-binding protein
MFQKTIVVGRVGQDAEMRYTASGVPVTSFSVASNRRWTGADGQPQEKTTWFRVTCWRKLAELTAQYVQKGKLVLVEGDIEARAFTDKGGNVRASLELTATTCKFLSSRGDGDEGVQAHAGPAGAQQPANNGGEEFPVREDDIPF